MRPPASAIFTHKSLFTSSRSDLISLDVLYVRLNCSPLLAEDRADNIKKYLKNSDSSLDIDTFNMAKRPNSISKLFKTEDSRIKKSIENAGLERERTDHVYPDKAGKSTVMVILKE